MLFSHCSHQGERFMKPGMTVEEAWDSEEDEKFVIKQ